MTGIPSSETKSTHQKGNLSLSRTEIKSQTLTKRRKLETEKRLTKSIVMVSRGSEEHKGLKCEYLAQFQRLSFLGGRLLQIPLLT